MSTWKTEKEDNMNMDVREIGCEDQRWLELAQDRVKWWGLLLVVLNLQVLLPQCSLISLPKINLLKFSQYLIRQ
jgi:hypothetical protein